MTKLKFLPSNCQTHCFVQTGNMWTILRNGKGNVVQSYYNYLQTKNMVACQRIR